MQSLDYQTKERYSGARLEGKITQNPCITVTSSTPRVSLVTMYRKQEQTTVPPENFELPFEGKLSSDNRWVIMADLIPWAEFEEEYSSSFSAEMGAPAKSFRVALGALIIKEKLGISDRETVEQIKENPYLQYFIGISYYSNEAPFDPSMLVHFRERISAEFVNKVNQKMVKKMLETTSSQSTEKKQKNQKKR